MRNTRVNKILFARNITIDALAARIERRMRKRCHREQVSMITNGRRFTPWLQKAVARELGYKGPELFKDWWYERRRGK
ncbi:MAG TPA: hypothetical protein VM492_13605 [Sumerlaeia bacterium]|nr:hypothetical protein [Sumerlaeia bacterium]